MKQYQLTPITETAEQVVETESQKGKIAKQILAFDRRPLQTAPGLHYQSRQPSHPGAVGRDGLAPVALSTRL